MCPCGEVEARVEGRPRFWCVRKEESSGIEGGGEGGVSILLWGGVDGKLVLGRCFCFEDCCFGLTSTLRFPKVV